MKPSSSKIESSPFTREHLTLIRDNPHVLGWMAGKTKLKAIHSKWIKYIWTSKKSVALMAHRGSYKSTAIVFIGTVWYLLFNPDARIAIIRKTYRDAADAVATIAKIMEMPIIRELFKFAHGEYPEFTQKKEGAVTFSFKKQATLEGSITAFGIASPLTGRHFDFILADDISTLKDRLSKAEREFTKNIWRELITNIIDRGKPCCFVGTPWAKEGVESIIPKPLKFSINDCDLISPEELEQIRSTTTPSLFAANYELEFVADDDALFKDPNYDEWQTSDIGPVVAHVDAAYGGDDFIAVTIGAERKGDKGIVQMVGFTYSGAISEWVPQISDILRLYKARKVYVEKQSDRGWTASMFRTQGFSVMEYDENMKKEHKIATYLYEVWPRIVWAKETDDEYMSQVVDWTALTKGHDDACLSGDTAILTPMGNRHIKDIKAGDMVMTPYGFRKVLWSGKTGYEKVISRFGLLATEDHRVYNGGAGYIPLSSCEEGEISRFTLRELFKWQLQRGSFLMENGFPALTRADTISRNAVQMGDGGKLNSFIRLFGSTLMAGKFLLAFTSIIKTSIQIIMIFLIWCYLRGLNTLDSMLNGMKRILNMLRIEKRLSTGLENQQKHGIVVQRGGSGTEPIQKTQLEKEKITSEHVSNAGKNSSPNAHGLCTAIKCVIGNHSERKISRRNAPSAERFLSAVGDKSNGCTVLHPVRIGADNEGEGIDVYNLTIEGIGVFYANGVLVSNCDSAASLVRARFSKKGYRMGRWEY